MIASTVAWELADSLSGSPRTEASESAPRKSPAGTAMATGRTKNAATATAVLQSLADDLETKLEHCNQSGGKLGSSVVVRVRTLRVAIVGGFVTRIAVGGLPFLLPMLYQVGLGYSPLESGLLIFPQSLAAMSLRIFMPHILRRFGYRRVLLSNTAIIGIIIALFALVGPGTPVWTIVAQAVALGVADWPRDEANVPRWIEAMVAAPELIQRPILLLDDGSAILGCSPEALAEAVRRSRDAEVTPQSQD